jgi:alkylated DNA repair protein (DNA oxidative demethylase)
VAESERRARRAAGPPPGFRLLPDALTDTEERTLVTRFDALAFDDVRFRGVIARRHVLHFGTGYGYEDRSLRAAPPVPDWLEPLRARAEEWTGIPAGSFVEMLITRYPPGAGIGWHRDAPAFGPTVVGVSLGAACVLRFRRSVGTAWERLDVELPPRSAYVIGGSARATWQHSIPPVRETRYSITLRTLRSASATS